MKVSSAPRRKNAGRPPEKDARQFLAWLRGRDCIFADSGECDGKIVAAHLDFAGGKGTGSKVADRYAVPIRGGPNGHHALQHRIGWQTFMARMGVTREALMIAAARLWNKWPGRLKWERDRAA